MLNLNRKTKESVFIDTGNELIKVTVKHFYDDYGNTVCLGFDAPKHVTIHREEIYKKIQAGGEFKPNRRK